MIIIQESAILIYDLLEKPKIASNCEYRWFTFLNVVNTKEGYLIYNLMTKELVLLNESEYLEAKKFNTDSQIFQKLFTKYFIVANELDDSKLYDQLLSVYSLYQKHDYNNFCIFTTTECNARCFYCYEAKGNHYPMTKNVAEDVADYIIGKWKKNRDKIKIQWFGGEPLFNSDVIDIISTKLLDANVDYSSTMISNGILFDRHSIDKIKKLWKLSNVQITLDGTEEMYNKIKNFIYTKEEYENPYRTVINNIHSLLDNNIFVNIRLNLEKYNFKNMYDLIDELSIEFGKNKYLSVYPKLLYENTGNIGVRNYIEYSECCCEFSKLKTYLKSKLNIKTLRIDDKFSVSSCMAGADNSTTITPRGQFTKCEHHYDSEIFGSIYDENKDMSVIKSWKNYRNNNDVCRKCNLYPMCFLPMKCDGVANRECDEFQKQENIEYLSDGMLKRMNEYFKK